MFCWVLLAPAGDDLFLPALLLCGRGSTSPAPWLGKPRGFSLKLRSAFQVPLAAYSEYAQDGEIFNGVSLGDIDLYR